MFLRLASWKAKRYEVARVRPPAEGRHPSTRTPFFFRGLASPGCAGEAVCACNAYTTNAGCHSAQLVSRGLRGDGAAIRSTRPRLSAHRAASPPHAYSIIAVAMALAHPAIHPQGNQPTNQATDEQVFRATNDGTPKQLRQLLGSNPPASLLGYIDEARRRTRARKKRPAARSCLSPPSLHRCPLRWPATGSSACARICARILPTLCQYRRWGRPRST